MKKDSLPREYFIDWLRVIAMAGIFILHACHFFDDASSWEIKNQQTSFGFTAFMGFLHFWLIPLFFFLSGCSACYSLAGRSPLQFLRERLLRIGIPALAGLFFLVIPMRYFLAVWQETFSGNIFSFLVHYLSTAKYRLSPLVFGEVGAHLWFLADLLIFSALLLPVAGFLKTRQGQRIYRAIEIRTSPSGAIFLAGLPLAAVQAVLRPLAPGYQNWADFFTWYLLFLYGYLFAPSDRLRKSFREMASPAISMALILYSVLIILYKTTDIRPCFFSPGYGVLCSSFQVLTAFITWTLLIFFLGTGLKYLNFSNRILGVFAPVVMAIYILHRPIMIIAGFFILALDTGISEKFFLVFTVTASAVALIVWIARSIPSIGFFIGIKGRQ